MANIDSIKKYKNIYMIGIGGISMSGIAEILVNWNFNVSGSDCTDSDIIKKLKTNNIDVAIGQNLDGIKKADLVVYTAAISKDNPELVLAKELNIPCVERADFLGELTKAFEDTIGISGTHGKTTTTSMISTCFLEAKLDPSIQVGAILKEIDGNYRVGNSPYFIIEACEYVESFLKFRPKSEVILNIDNDHLDYFKNLDAIKYAFEKYVKLLPDNGLLVLNADDENCLALKNFVNCKVVTYGINNNDANFVAKNISYDDNGFGIFDVFYNNNFYGHFELSTSGKHNILNALATISLCDSYNIDKRFIQAALKKFTGASRRLEYKGKLHGASIFDDYGHHPTEILATFNAINNKKFNESWVVFQPHTYSRTISLLNDFANSLKGFDHVIITDIYAAREKNTYGISSKDLADKINLLGKHALYISSFDEIVEFLKENVKEKDLVLTLGAGTVTEISNMLKEDI